MLEKQIQTIIDLNKMQFGFILGKGTVDPMLIVRGIQEEYHRKFHMCFVGLENSYDRVPRKPMERATRKNGLLKLKV